MKTLILFLDHTSSEEAKFFSVFGDYTHLNGVYINASDKELEEELSDLLSDGYDNFIEYTLAPTKDWNIFITCGMIA